MKAEMYISELLLEPIKNSMKEQFNDEFKQSCN